MKLCQREITQTSSRLKPDYLYLKKTEKPQNKILNIKNFLKGSDKNCERNSSTRPYY